MKFYYSLVLAMITVFAMTSQSEAAIVVSVDLDPTTAGIQASNPTDLNVGDQVTANLVLSLGAGDALTSYGFSVQFGDGLQFVGRTDQGIPGWFDAFPATQSGNTAFRFDGLNLSAQNGPFSGVVGSITLQVAQLAGSFNVTPGFFNPTIADEDFLDGGFNVIDRGTIGFSGGNVSVAAVPEPTSMAALAAAGVGGWIVRRRASRKKVAAAE